MCIINNVQLTGKELNILHRLVQHGYVKGAADSMGMHPNTFYNLLDDIRNKTNMTTVQLVYHATKKGAI
jgi:DNA-binding CsgD family transcriptional regulator